MLSIRPAYAKYKKYYWRGLLLKLIGGLGYALIYTFYYTYGGDTFSYFKDGVAMNNLMLTDFSVFWDYVFGDLAYVDVGQYNSNRGFIHQKGTAEFFVTRFTSIFTILGMQNFYTTTLLFAFFSFIGVWLMFLVFVRRYPEIEKKMAFAVLFIPSVFFWGSGLMKDSITIGFLGVLLYFLDKIKRKEGYKLINIIAVVIAAYIIFNVKAYILMSFLPAMILWYFMEYRERIRNRLIRVVSLPFFLVLTTVGISVSIVQLGKINEDYAVESFFKKARGIQTWHYSDGANTSDQYGRGSSYSLGSYEESYTGLIKVFPTSVNVTLFRPYITEISSFIMLFSAIESLILMIATIYIFIGLGFSKTIKILAQDSFLMMCFVFAIFFAFAVGFTSYNFGALVRYKIPCIPFFVASLLILEYESKKQKRLKYQRKKAEANPKSRQRR
jgi:hypothetical protein